MKGKERNKNNQIEKMKGQIKWKGIGKMKREKRGYKKSKAKKEKGREVIGKGN